MNTETHDFVDVWGIHSSLNEQPVFRDWAKTEEAARRRLEEIKVEDAEKPESDYWVVQMTRGELAAYQQSGLLPQNLS